MISGEGVQNVEMQVVLVNGEAVLLIVSHWEFMKKRIMSSVFR